MPQPEATQRPMGKEELEQHHSDCPPLPGHREHSCTDIAWLLLLSLAMGGLCYPIWHAESNGDLTKFFRGFDYKGRMCGRDVPGSFEFWCQRPGYPPDSKHPICVAECPNSTQQIHACFHEFRNGSNATVATPDYATIAFGRRCLQNPELDKTVAEGLSLLAQLEEPGTTTLPPSRNSSGMIEAMLKKAEDCDITTNLLTAAGSIKRGAGVLGAAFVAASLTGYIYLFVLDVCAKFLIRVSLLLMVIVPTMAGGWYLYEVYKNGILANLMSLEAQQHLLIGLGLLLVGCVMSCFAAKHRKGIDTATGCITASCDCIFEMPSILLEPFLSISCKVMLLGPLAYYFILLVSSGRMAQYWVDGVPFRRLVHSEEQKFYMAYTLFMFFWVMELIHSCSQYLLSFTAQRWYFTPYIEGMKGAMPCCMLLAGICNLFRYHIGTMAFGALLHMFGRGFKIFLKCMPRPKKGSNPVCCCCGEGCYALAGMLKKCAYMDVAITSSNYCSAASRAYDTMSYRVPAVAVLNGAQFVFQICGTGVIVASAVIAAGATVYSYKPYTQATSQLYLVDLNAVLVASAVGGLIVALAFMIVFDTVGDTILYCFALEEQRYLQVKDSLAGSETPRIFSACAFGRGNKSPGLIGWLIGGDGREPLVDADHRLEYAPDSLRQLIDDQGQAEEYSEG